MQSSYPNIFNWIRGKSNAIPTKCFIPTLCFLGIHGSNDRRRLLIKASAIDGARKSVSRLVERNLNSVGPKVHSMES